MAEQPEKSREDLQASFAHLGLSIGTPVTLETISPPRKYQVQLIGFVENRSVLISSPLREGKEVLLDKDSTVAIRLLVGKQVVAFESKVVYRSIQPFSYYHLAYPEDITALQVRNSERVTTNIEAQVDSDFDIVGEWPKPAYIDNLSKTGARMSSPFSLGEKGHELLVSFELNASGVTKTVCLPSIIRNIELNTEEEVGQQGRYIVGIQFVNLTDDQILTLSSYIYENERR